jgi:GMP synthase (glutamine-hydrolysing)
MDCLHCWSIKPSSRLAVYHDADQDEQTGDGKPHRLAESGAFLYPLAMTDKLLIIDFGSQVTQLIARRLRELNVYCEIHPFQNVSDGFLKSSRQRPSSSLAARHRCLTKVPQCRLPRCSRWACPSWVSAMASRRDDAPSAASVEGGEHHREVRPRLRRAHSQSLPLFEGWFVDGEESGLDEPRRPRHPKLAPGFEVIRHIAQCTLRDHGGHRAQFLHHKFHPEVVHTPHGATLYKNFVIRWPASLRLDDGRLPR